MWGIESEMHKEIEAMPTATKNRSPAPSQRPLHRFTVEQYHRMTEIGVLTTNDRVELLDGFIVKKMTQYPPHASTLSRLTRLFARLLPNEWVLRVQMPITLRTSEPEPDLAIALGPEETYMKRHPMPRDIALLIEVADSSLLRDKLPLYAGERLHECWLVNLVDRRIEAYSEPKGGRSPKYQSRRDYQKGEAIPLILKTHRLLDLAVHDLLPT